MHNIPKSTHGTYKKQKHNFYGFWWRIIHRQQTKLLFFRKRKRQLLLNLLTREKSQAIASFIMNKDVSTCKPEPYRYFHSFGHIQRSLLRISWVASRNSSMYSPSRLFLQLGSLTQRPSEDSVDCKWGGGSLWMLISSRVSSETPHVKHVVSRTPLCRSLEPFHYNSACAI